MRKHFLIIVIILLNFPLIAQINFNGIVTDEFDVPIENVRIRSQNFETHSNSLGEFTFELKDNQSISLLLDHILYESLEIKIPKPSSQVYHFKMYSEVISLEESVIQHHHETQISNSESFSNEFLKKEASGSLAQSLEKIPGIQSMNVGSSTSKPMIRGLGSNRISISENGLKQESQQWGADNGLEMSIWDVDKVEIIKGSAALEFGSDAIGGVISIKNDRKPLVNSSQGEFNVKTQTGNESLTSALNFSQRKNHFFYKLSGSFTDFADYKVPTDHLLFNSTLIPLKNHRLENTAGSDYSASALVGFTQENFETSFLISNYYQKVGFFPVSHGHVEDLQSDGNHRDVNYPYQNVNHFKIQNETTFRWNKQNLKFLLGYQNNHRQEWSEFHQHYGDEHDDHHHDSHEEHGGNDLELDFKLSTYDAQVNYNIFFSPRNKLKVGLQTQMQRNLINGFGFLLPEFNRNNYAAFAINELKIHPKWSFNYGIRYDYTSLNTEDFYDQHLFEYLIENGYNNQESKQLAQRSEALDKQFQNLNYAFGILFQAKKEWDFNFNLATNFRIPTAIELASNGIHHGSYRHEIGNPNLDPESGFSADFKIRYHSDSWNVELNPYIYQFSNYIYLNPTSDTSPLPGGGEIYMYEQSKARLTGFEFQIDKHFTEKLYGLINLEYSYNERIDSEKNEPLPLSPPLVIFSEWNYRLFKNKKVFNDLNLGLNLKYTADQNKVALNEKTTRGSTLIGASIDTKIKINTFGFDVSLKANNLFNKKYFNHLSFYRDLEIPEMGRTISLWIRIPFGN